MNKTVDKLLKTYLIGSMEAPANNDGGKGWRIELTPELVKRNIHVFDPTREEIDKVGMPTEELMSKLTGWQLSGNWNKFLQYMSLIWKGTLKVVPRENTEGEQQIIHILGDIDYVQQSDFLIMNYQEGDKPGGTIAELVIAWYRGTPVYMITTVPKSKFNKSILYFILDSGHGQGRVFQNSTQLLEFLDEKYKSKSEEKKEI